MKSLSLIIALSLLSGCGMLAGGGTYRYHYEEPSGKVLDITVDSVREVGPTQVTFSSNGTVDIKTEGFAPGPNNMGQALAIIDGLVKAATP